MGDKQGWRGSGEGWRGKVRAGCSAGSDGNERRGAEAEECQEHSSLMFRLGGSGKSLVGETLGWLLELCPLSGVASPP